MLRGIIGLMPGGAVLEPAYDEAAGTLGEQALGALPAAVVVMFDETQRVVPPRVCTAELRDGGVDRLLPCIRPVDGSAFALPGPDGIRTHRPHQLRGLGDPCPVQGSSVSVRPVLPSLVLCPRNRRRPRRRERVRANYAAFAP